MNAHMFCNPLTLEFGLLTCHYTPIFLTFPIPNQALCKILKLRKEKKELVELLNGEPPTGLKKD